MAKTATLTVRLDQKIKADAQSVFQKLGLTTTQAVNLFFNQVSLQRGLPFDLHIPNEQTGKSIAQALEGRNLKRMNNLDDLITGLK